MGAVRVGREGRSTLGWSVRTGAERVRANEPDQLDTVNAGVVGSALGSVRRGGLGPRGL